MRTAVRPLPPILRQPPLWLALLLATLLAAALLGAFVKVLHNHIRHSDEVRRVFGHPAPHAASARARLRTPVQASTATTLR